MGLVLLLKQDSSGENNEQVDLRSGAVCAAFLITLYPKSNITPSLLQHANLYDS